MIFCGKPGHEEHITVEPVDQGQEGKAEVPCAMWSSQHWVFSSVVPTKSCILGDDPVRILWGFPGDYRFLTIWAVVCESNEGAIISVYIFCWFRFNKLWDKLVSINSMFIDKIDNADWKIDNYQLLAMNPFINFNWFFT